MCIYGPMYIARVITEYTAGLYIAFHMPYAVYVHWQ